MSRDARFFAPEVVQSSAMDCGPAALKCLMEGFGLQISYDRLREACQTEVDGTSIDALEEVARRLGLDARQVMLPRDHLFLPEARALPALVAVVHPVGATHFLVVWRRHGPWVQVMDPAAGRLWMRVHELAERLYIHTLRVPARAWRRWAGSADLLDVLAARARRLRLGSDLWERLLAEALEDPDWPALAALDATLRMAEALHGAGALRRGRQAAALVRRCFDHDRRACDPSRCDGGYGSDARACDPSRCDGGYGSDVRACDPSRCDGGYGSDARACDPSRCDGGYGSDARACDSSRCDGGHGSDARARGAGSDRGAASDCSVEIDERAVPAVYWCVEPVATPPPADGADEDEGLLLRGAVLVRVRGRRRAAPAVRVSATSEPPAEQKATEASPPPEQAAEGRQPADLESAEGPEEPLPADLRAAVDAAAARPGREVARALWAGGRVAAVAAAAMLAVVSVAAAVETAFFRVMVDLPSRLALPRQRLGAAVALLVFLGAVLGIELSLTTATLGLGRRLEMGFRLRLLRRVVTLGDRYFRSRLVSDMAERCHNAYRLRMVPEVVANVLRNALQLGLTAACIAWLEPAVAWIAGLSVAVALGLSLAAQPILQERDLRLRNHGGALGRHFLDALLGLVPARHHGAEMALRREHEGLLVEWARAARRFERATLALDVLQAVTGYGLAIGLLFGHLRARPGHQDELLLLSYWALLMPILGQQLDLAARQLPLLRNTALRLLEPLAAAQEQGDAWSAGATGDTATRHAAGAAAAEGAENAAGATSAARPDVSGDATSAAAGTGAAEGTESAARDTSAGGADVSRHAAIGSASRPGLPGERGQPGGPAAWPLAGTAPHRGVAIRFEGVDVVASGHRVLQGIGLAVAPGAQLAIVGASGAGKSSLAGLLLGWHRPARGRVVVDGAELTAERLAALRRDTAWVDPAVQLWNAPLLENLLYGLEGAGCGPSARASEHVTGAADEGAARAASAAGDVGAVVDAAHLRQLVQDLPTGLQTPLGEGGALVSGGEGQRIRFARGLLRRDARLVILDEPFRGLDGETRAALLRRARAWWRGATLLCITHDIEQTLSFDGVAVMDGGRLAETGSPRQLAASPRSLYSALLAREAEMRHRLRPGAGWKWLRLAGGRLVETIERFETAETFETIEAFEAFEALGTNEAPDATEPRRTAGAAEAAAESADARRQREAWNATARS